jgi:hypothetical protein
MSSPQDPPRGRAPRPSQYPRQQAAWRRALAPKRAALVGLVAFLAGYVLTAVAFIIEVRPLTSGGDGSNTGGIVASIIDSLVGVGGQQVVNAAGGELVLALRTIGWTFLSAHWVPLTGNVSGFGQTAAGEVDLLTLAGNVAEIPLTPMVYYLIPTVCVVVAGWWLAGKTTTHSPAVGAVAGGQLIVGYLACMVLAAVLLAFSATVDILIAAPRVTAKPVLTSAMVMGSVYALVGGAAGGVVRILVRSRRQV